MKELKDNNLCSNGGELLGYLYDEMPAADRDKFELHLADCGTCIDDFAELSQGRYPVFEWKALEFDAMPTPRFVMPAQPVTLGLFDRLRTAFAVNRGFAFGSAAAAVLVAVLAGYALYFQSVPETDIAGANSEPTASPAQRVISSPLPAEINSTARNEVDEPSLTVTPKTVTRRPAPAKAAASKTKPISPAKTLNVKAPVQPRKPVPSIPVLSIVEDDEDESLRLADMFEDIGASE